ncbi:MAG: HPr family phosphocarrier protein [Acidobacteria bacterium]|nr:HPr family phosphocarrier protein [Acidobacteriota bacterium]
MISNGVATVAAAEGLHARPAADFVRAVTLSGHQVELSNSAGRVVDGSSILGVLSLAVKQGEQVHIQVSGPDSQAVLEGLIAVVSGLKRD